MCLSVAACGANETSVVVEEASSEACSEAEGCDDDSQDDTSDDEEPEIIGGVDDSQSDELSTCPEVSLANTVGLTNCLEGVDPGYTLFAPMRSTGTYLIDIAGRLVHSWASGYPPGLSVYLLEDGRLLRSTNTSSETNVLRGGGAAGGVEILDWDSNVLWTYSYNTENYRSHHDIEVLPNGNILMVGWEKKTAEEAIARGRDTDLLSDGELWVDHVIELAPRGENEADVVWEWHLWDHLIQDRDPSLEGYGSVSEHPGLLDINFVRAGGSADWNHINAIDYNADLDQILLSSHHMSELYIIDHATSPEEASGHVGGARGQGGDLLYRWGNPQAYQRGTPADQMLFVQHDARWIENGLSGEGQIMVFNNGTGRQSGDYSSVDVIEPPLRSDGAYALDDGAPFGPRDLSWSYAGVDEDAFVARNISGAHRLSNGNTLVCDGPSGSFREVTPEGDRVWDYVSPVVADGIVAQGNPVPSNQRGQENTVFRATRYGSDYPGLQGHSLVPGGTLESTGTR